MIPRWHVLWGAVFTLVLWIVVPSISYLYLVLVFLSSFLIDFDHYWMVGWKEGKWRLKENLKRHREMGVEEEKERDEGIRRRGHFHLFHTVEFHLLVGLLGLLWIGFFYIFIGMVFHSLLDVFWLLRKDRFYRREYFLVNWVRKKL
tara:strand:+ start:4763 stop:5200 length:438 start_codon:yes stop_codon:yes gene_type:complete